MGFYKKKTTSTWREHLTTSFGQNLQVSANPQPRSESLACKERRDKEENLQPDSADPETQRLIYAEKYAGCPFTW